MSSSRSTGSLDTNLLFRWLLNDIPAQAKKVDKLLSGKGNSHVSDITIIELVFVLEKNYQMPRSQVAKNILTIIEQPAINMNRQLFSRVLNDYQIKIKLSVVDICLCFYAELNKAEPLYTFDKKLTGQMNQAKELK